MPELVVFAVWWLGDMVTVGTVGVCGVVEGGYDDGGYGWRLRYMGSTASVNVRVVLGLEIAPKGGVYATG